MEVMSVELLQKAFQLIVERRRMMSKRKYLIFFTLVFAIVALFAASDAMAFNNGACYGWNYHDSIPLCVEPQVGDSCTIGNKYTVSLVSVTPIEGEDGWFQWCYKMENNKGTASGIDWFGTCIPDCCTEKIEVKLDCDSPPALCHDDADAFTQRFDPGEGETSNQKFGNLNQDCFVVKGTSDDDTIRCFVANTDQMTVGTFALKYKGSADSCELPIPRCTPAPEPQCVPQGTGASTYTECVNWYGDPLNPEDDVSFKIVRRGDRDGCIQSLHLYQDLSCDDGNSNMAATQDDLPGDYVSSGALRPGTCPDEVTNVRTGSPWYLYEVVSGGYVFRGCLDLGNYKWEPNIKCCTHGTEYCDAN